MMLRFLLLPYILCCGFWVSGQSDPLLVPPSEPLDESKKIERRYFLEGRDLVENGGELVILVNEAQTQMAREMGAVIVRDTSFLRFVQDSIYKTLDGRPEIIHFCGHDLYFYAKYGSNLQFIKAVNSNCGLNEFGCENMNRLLAHSEQLEMDTVNVFDAHGMKRRGELKSILALSIENQGWNQNEMFLNTTRVPSSFDRKYTLSVHLDNCSPILDQLKKYSFSHIPNFEHQGIGIHFENGNKMNQYGNFRVLNEGLYELDIYLDEACVHYFPNQNMETIDLPKKVKLRNERLLIIREKNKKLNR